MALQTNQDRGVPSVGPSTLGKLRIRWRAGRIGYTHIKMPFIFLVGKDWTARALLGAQLIEEGFDVEAYESVQAGVARLQTNKEMPGLLVADLSQSGDSSEDALQLSQWSKLAPIWVMASHGFIEAEMLEGRGFEKVFFRPVDMGKLVQQIKERLK